MSLLQRFFLVIIATACFAPPVLGQTGKIAGTVSDAETGNPLPGVNVVIVGTQQGATTNAQGQYSILNVTPGTYDVRASFVGFAPQTVEGVQVNANLTTEQDFALQEQTAQLEEVTVQATEPVVKRDVSANVANIDMEQDIEGAPVASVQEVIGLQAGIEDGLSIRGSGADEAKMMVDGLSISNPRTNDPFTGISFTSVDQVQVQTGGFNAEYGNVRSGLVNVTTKEGPRDSYTADVLYRYSPASRKHLGPVPSDPNSFWMRPYVTPGEEDLLAEDDVAYLGTHSEESPWDEYTRAQYPEFEGWQEVSRRLMEDDDPSNDLTPEQAQQQFLWYHRKEFPTTSDYVLDGSIGGPIPLVSEPLGDLRFFASYRQNKNAFVVPQRRDAWRDRLFQVKLTSNVASNMKLNVLGLYNMTRGQYGGDAYTASQLNRSWLFALDRGSLTNTRTTQLGAKFTHTLGSNTFYELQVQRSGVDYRTGPGPMRDFDEVANTIGPIEYNEAPFGFNNQTIEFGPSGMELGGRWGLNRDSTDVETYNFQGDVTSQITQFSQIKTGIDFNYTDYNSATGIYNPVQPSVSNPKYYWHRRSAQGAAYLQNKFEFESIVANLGVRLDYFQPLGDWYNLSPFDPAFAENNLDDVESEPIEGQWALSPRLGVSFPVTENSKLYFNYGHFRNVQQLPQIFRVRTIFGETAIDWIGNPNMPMAKTVAYELGYDQNIFDIFLLRISGYYKALEDQPRQVVYQGRRRVSYQKPLPLNYEDIRGAEFSLEKNTGRWVRGEINYTYMVRKEGNFGYGSIFESRSEMREYIRQSGINILSRPTPQPYANLRLSFRTPTELGPQVLGGHPLGDWWLGFIGSWQAGQLVTYTGFQDNIDVDNNLRWKDYWNLDLRFTKSFEAGLGEAQLFIDVNNVLNIRHALVPDPGAPNSPAARSGFDGSFDYQRYMQSLHLPEETFEEAESGDPYLFPYGDDQPGDYREPGTPFVPIETVNTLDDVSDPMHRPLYYVREEGGGGTYMWYRSGSFEEAEEAYVNAVLENKQYIDMPNDDSYTFLNPRDIWFGLRLTLE